MQWGITYIIERKRVGSGGEGGGGGQMMCVYKYLLRCCVGVILYTLSPTDWVLDRWGLTKTRVAQYVYTYRNQAQNTISFSQKQALMCTCKAASESQPENVAELTLHPFSRRKLTRMKFSASTA